jgi:hypothetical protein
LYYVLDEEGPASAVGTLYDALPAGSYVFIHHMLDSEDPGHSSAAGVARKARRQAVRP